MDSTLDRRTGDVKENVHFYVSFTDVSFATRVSDFPICVAKEQDAHFKFGFSNTVH